jgi:hypothetical protein
VTNDAAGTIPAVLYPGVPTTIYIKGTNFGSVQGYASFCTPGGSPCNFSEIIEYSEAIASWTNTLVEETVTMDPRTPVGTWLMYLNVPFWIAGSDALHPSMGEVEMEAVPTVLITGPQGVAQGGSDTFSVSVSGPLLDYPVTITLATNNGTGSATFADGTTSTTISSPQTLNLTVKGVQASSAANNVTISADFGGELLASQQFSVVSVSISLNMGTVSPGDSAWVNFSQGASTLGSTITNFPGSIPVCAVAVELAGTVAPSDYTGPITLRRSKNAYAYKGTQLVSGYPELGDDTSQPPSLDTNPQSTAQGAAQGVVYDLDAPGISAPGSVADPAGSPDWFNHFRSNFVEYAILGSYNSAIQEADSNSPKNASGTFQWYAVASCTFDPTTGDTVIDKEFNSAGDNQAGKNTTLTTYNLRPPQ